jgi:hypothetical protein
MADMWGLIEIRLVLSGLLVLQFLSFSSGSCVASLRRVNFIGFTRQFVRSLKESNAIKPMSVCSLVHVMRRPGIALVVRVSCLDHRSCTCIFNSHIKGVKQQSGWRLATRKLCVLLVLCFSFVLSLH